jgi:hypothetical protein
VDTPDILTVQVLKHTGKARFDMSGVCCLVWRCKPIFMLRKSYVTNGSLFQDQVIFVFLVPLILMCVCFKIHIWLKRSCLVSIMWPFIVFFTEVAKKKIFRDIQQGI